MASAAVHPAPDRSRWVGAALIATSAASFGAMAIFARVAYDSGANVFTVLTLRFALAAAVLLVVVRVRGLPLPRGRTLLALAALGGIGYVGQSVTFFTALTLAPAGLVSLLLYLYPGFVTVLAAATGRERLTRTKLAALVLALVGSALTVGGSGGLTRPTSGMALGVLLGVAAAVIYAAYIVAGAGVTARAGAIPSTAVITGTAAVVLAVPMAAGGPRLPHGTGGWAAVGAIALVSTVLAIVTFFAGLARLGPSTAATLSTLEPVVTVALAALLLAEPFGPVQLAGGALILTAIVLLVHTGRQPRPAAPAT
ncbi:DMT family transporter [Planosporangium sp. 12N6]|uniref:DMT family transporter n=1 Tax=Planosporangium spinosum TaxID=3402278 RepID=UPI003CF26AC9